MRFTLIAALAVLAAPIAAEAALPVGSKAPDFNTQGALGGKTFAFSLSRQLKKGPVVLYFFPAAFTKGCTLEAHEFAEATDDFNKAGATVIGLAADPIDTLARFSVEECRNKFAVGVASSKVVKAYDVAIRPSGRLTPEMVQKMAGRTDRTSYVIAPNGRILYAHSDIDYRDHVKNTLAAVRKWKAGKKR